MLTRYGISDYFAQWGYISTFVWVFFVSLCVSHVALLHSDGGDFFFCRRVPVVLVSQARRRFSCSFLRNRSLEERRHTFHLMTPHIVPLLTVLSIYFFIGVSQHVLISLSPLMRNLIFKFIFLDFLLLSLSATHKCKHLYFCYNNACC